MAKGKLIGKIAVKVYPDTRKFKKELKEELEKIEKELQGLQVQVKPVISDEDVVREARRAKNTFEAILSDISIEPRISDASVLREALRTKNTLDAYLHEVDVSLNLDTVDLAAKLAAARAAIQTQLATIPANIRVRVNQRSAITSSAQLARLARDRKAVIKPVLDNKALRAVGTALARLSGYRAGRESLHDITKFLSNLDMKLPKIALVSTGVAGLGASALSASANLFALSAALAEIGAGAIALPGMLFSAGAAVGVLVAALKDFSKVLPDVVDKFKELQNFISARFWRQAEAPIRRMVNRLFPEMRRGVGRIAAAWGSFMGTFSDEFATVFGNGVMERMLGRVAKGIAGLEDNADSFANILRILGDLGSKVFIRFMNAVGDIADQWSDWLTEAEKTGRLDFIVHRAIANLKDLFRIVSNIGGIFAGIADAAEKAIGGRIMDKLADKLEKIHKVVDSADFQKELTEVFVAARKAMDNIARRSGPALQRMFKNLGNLVERIFPDVGDIIGDVLGGIADAFNDPRARRGIARLFEGLKNFARDVRPAMDEVGAAIGAVLELLGSFTTAIGPSTATAMETFAGVFETLADGLRPLVEGLVPAVGGLLDELAPGIKKVADAVAAFASGDGGRAIVDFVDRIKEPVGDIWDTVTDVVAELTKIANDIGPKVAEVLGDIVDDIAKFLKDHKDTLIKALQDIASALGTILGWLDGEDGLASIAGELVAGLIILKLARHFGRLALNVGKLGVAIKTFPILTWLGALIALLATIVISDPDTGVLGGINHTLRALGEIFDFLTPFGDNKDAFGWLKDAGKSVADALKEMGAAAENALNPLGLLWDFMTGKGENDPGEDMGGGTDVDRGGLFGDNLGGSLGKLLDGLMGQFIDWKPVFEGDWTGFFKGLADKIPGDTGQEKMQTILKGLGDKVLGHIPIIGPIWDSLWKTGDDSTKSWQTTIATSAQGIVDGIKKKLDDAVAWVQGLPQRAVDALDGIGSSLKDAGINLIEGFKNGITEAAHKVADAAVGAATNAVQAVRNFLGIHSPSRVFHQLGGHTIDGFVDGLESRYQSVRESLGGLAKDVARTPFALDSSGMQARLNGALDESAGSVNQKVLNYYAAPGSSLGSEEDLFAAASRTRMGW